MRDIRIGARLALGFGLILAASCALLVGAMFSTAAIRSEQRAVAQAAIDREDLAVQMRQSLLSSAMSVRSMGLQTQVDGVQRDEAAAKKAHAEYRAARGKLEAAGLDAQDKAVMERLSGIDAQMGKHFSEAVDLASTFNTEQAAAVIMTKIDPLMPQLLSGLGEFIALQKARTTAATEAGEHRHARVSATIGVIGGAVLLLAGVLAWRITVSITLPLNTAVQASTRVARGDLVSQIELSGRDEATQLLAALQAMRSSLARMVSEVRQGAQSLDHASSEIAQGNAELSERTESQASALQQTTASVQMLTSTVQHNADSTAQALQLSQSAARQSEQGHAVVSQVIETMSAINEHSRKISDITSVINSIAFQTNILALNAAVEAARAGEQGRGFAVVASEVRILSQRTTTAAKEIETLIRAAAERTESGTVLVNQAGSTMDQVRQSVHRVADLVNEISAANREQTSGIEEVNSAISDIDRSTQQNAALVEQAAAASESMREQTQRLNQSVSAFEV